MPPPPELLDTSPPSDNDTCVVDPDPTQEDPFDTPPPHAIDSILWKLYLSHALSTWNARAFEFGAVIFLSAIFPGTLFYASIYALIRALAAFVFSAQVGKWVDSGGRLEVVRQTIVWQRVAVAVSCGILLVLLRSSGGGWWAVVWFSVCVVLGGVEKLAFVGNTVAVERDWVVVVADGLGVAREELNSGMRRVDLVCKLVAPLGVSLVDGYSTQAAIWAVLGQNILSVVFEYFAIAQVYKIVPELHSRSGKPLTASPGAVHRRTSSPIPSSPLSTLRTTFQPWKAYFLNPAFLASFSLALLYFTVLGFGSQLTTYLLTLGLTPIHISAMRLISVILELTATCAAPLLMRRIGAVRAGLWFINLQLLATCLAIGLFTYFSAHPLTSGLSLVAGVTLSRLGLWGFDLCVQYLVQEDAPEASRGSFSAVEASLQNLFELCSFATTMVWAKPRDFKWPVRVSGMVVAVAAMCFAAFVRGKRGHLLHTSRCLEKRSGKYSVLPTIAEESEVELEESSRHDVVARVGR